MKKKICIFSLIALSVVSYSQSFSVNKSNSTSAACYPPVTSTLPSNVGLCDGTIIIDFSGCSNPPFDIYIPSNCSTPNVSMTGIVGPSYTVTNICGCASSYVISITNGIGEGGGSVVSVSDPAPNGISEILYANAISISPNPANDVLSIDLKSTHNANNKIEISNTLGQIVLYQTLLGDKIESFNIQHLPNGIYFVKAYTDNKEIGYKKIVVQK